MVKNLPASAGDTGLIPKIPWKRAQQPTPVFLPGKSHGQRSLLGYSPQGCKKIGHDLATKQKQQSNIQWEILRRNMTWGTMGNLEKSPPLSLCGLNSFSWMQDEPEALSSLFLLSNNSDSVFFERPFPEDRPSMFYSQPHALLLLVFCPLNDLLENTASATHKSKYKVIISVHKTGALYHLPNKIQVPETDWELIKNHS